jgi:hypothetical protein
MNKLICDHVSSHPPPDHPHQTQHPIPQGLLPVETRFVISVYLVEWQHSKQNHLTMNIGK